MLAIPVNQKRLMEPERSLKATGSLVPATIPNWVLTQALKNAVSDGATSECMHEGGSICTGVYVIYTAGPAICGSTYTIRVVIAILMLFNTANGKW